MISSARNALESDTLQRIRKNAVDSKIPKSVIINYFETATSTVISVIHFTPHSVSSLFVRNDVEKVQPTHHTPTSLFYEEAAASVQHGFCKLHDLKLL